MPHQSQSARARRARSPLGLAVLIALCLGGPLAAAAQAATDTLYAAPAAGGTADCSSAANACTIQTAVTNANALPTTDDVRIELADGVYAVSAPAPTALPITFAGPSLTIEAAAGTPILDGGNATRVLSVGATSTVTIRGLTIRAGTPSNALGGAIQNDGTLTVTDSTLSGNTAANGGAISNTAGATLTVRDSTFSANAATSVGGGAIIAFGSATVERSAFLDNTAPVNGGAVNVQPGAVVTVTRSTFSGNTSGGLGGALSNLGTVTVQGSTIAGNSATSGSVVATGGTSVTFAADLIGPQTSGDACNPNGTAIVDGGYNLDTDGTCISASTPATGSHNGTTAYGSSTYGAALDAYLADTPANNGGPTKTFALLNSPSPATSEADPAFAAVPATFDFPVAVGGVSKACALADQRGVVPVAGESCAIGAYLLQATKLALTTPQAVAGRAVTITATITPAANGGTVSFDDGTGNPAATQCTAQSVANGTATCTVTYASTGDYPVTATYTGDGTGNNFAPSASVTQTLTVAAAPPVVTPPVVTPPVTPPVVPMCDGRKVVLTDLRRQGNVQLVDGRVLVAPGRRTVRVTADHGGGSATATIGTNGTFTARLPLPTSRDTSYRASYGATRSAPLKLFRHLSILSRTEVPDGLRIVFRHAKRNRVAGQTATILRQSGCGRQTVFTRVKFDAQGEATLVLPFATPPDTVAVYRVTSKTNRTYTLPLVVSR